LDFGKFKLAEVGIAEDIEDSEAFKFLKLATNMFDMWCAIIVVMCLATFRYDGRVLLFQVLLYSRDSDAK
jgi:hypothetical protein